MAVTKQNGKGGRKEFIFHADTADDVSEAARQALEFYPKRPAGYEVLVELGNRMVSLNGSRGAEEIVGMLDGTVRHAPSATRQTVGASR